MESSVSRKRLVAYTLTGVAVGIGIAVALNGHGLGLFRGPGIPASSGDEDRPPIIVRDGSVIFDGGDAAADSSTWKDWVQPSSGSPDWRPEQAKGASVVAFAVSVVGADAANCAATSMEGQFVSIEFTDDVLQTVSTLSVKKMRKTIAPGHSKWEPDVTPPAGGTFTHVVQTDTPLATGRGRGGPSKKAPGQLVYGPDGEGWISKVTVDGVSCGFTKPDPTQRPLVQVKIQPER